jgi:Tfp pilus assembly protein PilV
VKKLSLKRAAESGATLVEVVIASAITVTLAGILAVGLITVQRTFAASEHHANSQTAQIRIVDYIARDLRRALTVTARAGGNGIDLTIPDYYANADTRIVTPRDPQITATGDVVYGTRRIPISYSERIDAKGNHLVCRTYDGVETVLATDVEKFDLDFPAGFNGDVFTVTVSFVPRFQMSGAARERMREGTTVFNSTLLRNKRATTSS